MKTTEHVLSPSQDLATQALIREARRRQWRRRLLIATAVVAVVAVALGVLGSAGGGMRRHSATGTQRQPGAVAGPRLSIRWRISVPAGVVSMTVVGGSLWVTGIGAVTRIDATSGKVIARISTPLTRELAGVASLDGKIWVSSGGFGDNAGLLYEIDPATNRVVRTFAAPGQPSAMTAGAGYLWADLLETGATTLRPFDPRTGRFGRPAIATFEELSDPDYGLGSVWVTSAEPAGDVWRIDPKSMRVSALAKPATEPHEPLYGADGPGEITTAAGSAWISFLWGVRIGRVNAATGRLEEQLVTSRTEGAIPLAAGGWVWVLFKTGSSSPSVYLPSPQQPGRVGLIDPRTGRFDGRALRIGDSGGYDSFAAAPAHAWVGDFSRSTVTAINLTLPR